MTALASRPELLVVTKMDVTGAEEAARRIGESVGREPLAISAVTGKGLPSLLARITEMLADLSEAVEIPPAPSLPE